MVRQKETSSERINAPTSGQGLQRANEGQVQADNMPASACLVVAEGAMEVLVLRRYDAQAS